jgi:transposase
MSALTGMSRTTITKAISELRGRGVLLSEGRVRRAGAGRKRLEETDPEIVRLVKGIVEETTAGDPESPLKWTSKGTRTISSQLTDAGHPMSASTVRRCLEEMGYSLQANRKTKEGPQHRDRDAQFKYIARQAKTLSKSGDPVISVDTKKKELIGLFRNAGRAWRKRGKPQDVNVHDFPSLGKGKAIPYGAYDIARNRAVVNVGISHDTAEFAVESIRRWWRFDGRGAYRSAQRLLICADSGGSNSARAKVWKVQIQELADQIRLPITVCHYPPGTSKWNKIEHRLFSFISLNWKGRPLVNYETVVNLIGGTRTRSGLRVKAVLDTNEYALGVKAANDQIAGLSLERHRFHPDWNYTLMPRSIISST